MNNTILTHLTSWLVIGKGILLYYRYRYKHHDDGRALVENTWLVVVEFVLNS